MVQHLSGVHKVIGLITGTPLGLITSTSPKKGEKGDPQMCKYIDIQSQESGGSSRRPCCHIR